MEKLGMLRINGIDWGAYVKRIPRDNFSGKVYTLRVWGRESPTPVESLGALILEACKLGTLTIDNKFKERHTRVMRKYNEYLRSLTYIINLGLDSSCARAVRAGYFPHPSDGIVEVFICKFVDGERKYYDILLSNGDGVNAPSVSNHRIDPSFVSKMMDAIMNVNDINGIEWDEEFVRKYDRHFKSLARFLKINNWRDDEQKTQS